MSDAAALARAIVDDGRYMTLATADAGGRPWATPVWYAPDAEGNLLWVSRPDTRHSGNIGTRAEVGIVIFDSRASPGSGRGVYIDATAHEVPRAELEPAIAAFSARSQSQRLAAWTTADVTPPAQLRLYRATPIETFYGEHDRRVRVR